MERAKTRLLKSLMTAKDWGGAGRSQPRLALVLVLALALLVVLTVSAEAETLLPVTPSSASEPSGPVKTHSRTGDGGDEDSFSIACDACHVQHEASGSQLLRAAEGAAVCATCHDANDMHEDAATQQSVLSTSGDCFTCHPHSAGFMPVSGAVSLSLGKTVVGYDDLDVDGALSPGDRVHYRIDYGNPGPEDATGVLLRDEPDMAHVAGVESITDGGAFDGTAIQWNVGTLAAGASGFVTYDVVLQGATAFDGAVTTTTDSTTTTATTDGTTTTATTDSTATTTPPTAATSTAVDVVNTASLTADERTTVSVSATVSVLTAGPATPTSSSTSTSSIPTETSTTAGAGPTTSTTIPPGSVVINTAALTGDNRAPVSTSTVVFVVVPGLAETLTPTSTTEGPTAVADPTALTLSEQVEGYDDLDADGKLSPGDRLHYRIDYGNPGPEDATGVLLRDEPDTDHVASIDAITDGGAFDGTVIQWNVGTLAAGASGFVTYDSVLKDALAFGGTPTTSTTLPATTDTATTTTEAATTTTTTVTTDSTGTTDNTTTTTTTDSTGTSDSTATTDTSTTTDSTVTTTPTDPPTPTTSAPIAAGVALLAFVGAPTRRLLSRT